MTTPDILFIDRCRRSWTVLCLALLRYTPIILQCSDTKNHDLYLLIINYKEIVFIFCRDIYQPYT